MSARAIRPSTLLLCFLLVPLLGGCAHSTYTSDEAGAAIVGGGSTSTETATVDDYVEAPAASPVAIQKSGWWDKDSYVRYGIMVENPNNDLVACDTQVHVSLRNEEGAVVYESTDTIAEIAPGQTIGFAGISGDGWAPTTVDIELVTGSTKWRSADSYVEPLRIESMAEQNKLYFRYELTGQITNETPEYMGTVTLSAILFDDQGNIVAGYSGEAYKIKGGQTKSYLLTLHSAPDHASVQLFAQPES